MGNRVRDSNFHEWRNLFAKHELNVAQLYYKREAYVAASNRASYLVENYPQAPEAEAALVMLVDANRKLGMMRAADDALRVLHLNYPNSPELVRLTPAHPGG